MARNKETLYQRDFSLGEVRKEAAERDDTEILERSVRGAENTITLTTGQIEARPGTVYQGTTTGRKCFEVHFPNGVKYEMVIVSDGVELWDKDGKTDVTFSSGGWVDIDGAYYTTAFLVFSHMDFWVVEDPDTYSVIIGSEHIPPQQLKYDGSSWSISAFEFYETLSGKKGIPFWRHFPDVTIQPSDVTGSVNVTASSGIWDSAHVGNLIRYNGKQLEITSITSATVAVADVIEELPPTKVLTVSDPSGFSLGDAVEDQTAAGQGVITGISGSDLTVLVTTNYTSFEATNNLVGPSAISEITTVAAAASSAATFLWDMQLWGEAFGYAGDATRHGGSLYLCGFPSTPRVYCRSQVYDIFDFTMGTADDAGFVETIGGDTGGELRYMISSEDLLFLTSAGLYFHQTRGGTAITPLNISPKRFSSYGCGEVRPVSIDAGAVFVDSGGSQIHGIVLGGDVYKSWKVERISRYAPHLMGTVVTLGATSSGSNRPEMFVAAVLNDGNAIVAQWNIDDGVLSWRPWTTEGAFRTIYEVNNGLGAIVARAVDGFTYEFREHFEEGVYLDCAARLYTSETDSSGAQSQIGSDPTNIVLAKHLAGETVSVYYRGYDFGELEVKASGLIDDGFGNDLVFPGIVNGEQAQVGFNFEVDVLPWARRSAKSPRGLRSVKRIIQMYVTVQDTGPIEIDGELFGNYRVGEDFSEPPPLRSEQYKVTFVGSDSFEERHIKRMRPGPFRILKIGYRVVI